MAQVENTGTPPTAGPSATVDERQLLKSMHWYDGFVVALANPGFMIASLGFTIGSLGALGALAVWTGSMVIGVLQNKIYTEPATMFPDRSGGIPIYAFEGWKRYFTFAGPLAAVGYWAGWSAVLAVFGLTIGSLAQAQWFTHQTWSTDAFVHLDFTRVVAIGLILLVWFVNTRGVKPAKWVGYVTGALLMVPLALFIVLPYLIGGYHGSNLSFGLFAAGGSTWGIIKLIMVWLYLNGWSAYGVEVCATFAPEYHDPHRDTTLALRRSAIFSLAVYALLPLGLGGVLSASTIKANPLTFYVTVLQKEIGSAGASVVIACIIGSFILAMNTATMDGARALYGISKSGMTVKWLNHLNRFHVPSRGMDVDMVVNILAVLFLPTTVAILAASNLGYILCHFFALSGILLLRRDRPDWPRPFRLATPWLYVAGVLAVLNLALAVVGSTSFGLTGYGGKRELLIGIGVLVVACLLYVYRRIAEDRAPVRLRDLGEDAPAPSAVAGEARA
ncbi:MAG: APC family permease [Gaiellaceae bacterium]